MAVQCDVIAVQLTEFGKACSYVQYSAVQYATVQQASKESTCDRGYTQSYTKPAASRRPSQKGRLHFDGRYDG